MNHTVVILAAGLGTRMRSKRAKVLHRAGGLALVEQVVAAARTLAPYGRIFVVTGHQAELVEALLQPLGVGFVRQQGQKGTGHALASCRDAVPHDGLLTGALRRYSVAVRRDPGPPARHANRFRCRRDADHHHARRSHRIRPNSPE